jgi:hypothetical protein
LALGRRTTGVPNEVTRAEPKAVLPRWADIRVRVVSSVAVMTGAVVAAGEPQTSQ